MIYPIDKKFVSEVAFVVENFNDEDLTELKLEKLLYFAEAAHFEEYGKTISCCGYYNNKNGPTPNYLCYKQAIEHLIDNGFIKEKRLGKYKGFVSVKSFKVALNDSEIKKLKATCSYWKGKKASSLWEKSHMDAPFLASDYRKQIDFTAVYQRFDKNELKPLKI